MIQDTQTCKGTNKRREKTILYKQFNAEENQVKQLNILSFSRILYKIFIEQ